MNPNALHSSSYAPIAVAYGDGGGPDHMQAALHILAEARARLEIEHVELGEAAYRRDIVTGITGQAWDVIRRSAALLRGPVVSPPQPFLPDVAEHLTRRLGLGVRLIRLQRWLPEKKRMQRITLVHSLDDALPALSESHPEEDSFIRERRCSRHDDSWLLRVALAHAAYYRLDGLTCVTERRLSPVVEGMRARLCDLLREDYPSVAVDHATPTAVMEALLTAEDHFTPHPLLVTNAATARMLLPLLHARFADAGLSAVMDAGEEYACFYPLHGTAEAAHTAGSLEAALLLLEWLGQRDVARQIRLAWVTIWEVGKCLPAANGEADAAVFAEAVIGRLAQKTPRKWAAAVDEAVEYPPVLGRILTPLTTRRWDALEVTLESDTLPSSLADRITPLLPEGLTLAHIRQGETVWWPAQVSRMLSSAPEQGLYTCRVEVDASASDKRDELLCALIRRLAEAGHAVLSHRLLFRYDDVRGYLEPEAVFVS